jgi:hypothetical protein
LEEIMQPRIKVGLLVGAIGLILNICVSGAIGLCGPAVSLVGGALAGFFTAKQENPASKGEGARAGAISGAIAGALILIGQIIAAVGALALFQFGGMKIPFSAAPSISADVSTQILYYASGVGTGVCFGLIGTVLAALVGAGTGYLGTPDRPQVPSNS